MSMTGSVMPLVSIDEKPVRRCAEAFWSKAAAPRLVSIDEKPVRRCAHV